MMMMQRAVSSLLLSLIWKAALLLVLLHAKVAPCWGFYLYQPPLCRPGFVAENPTLRRGHMGWRQTNRHYYYFASNSNTDVGDDDEGSSSIRSDQKVDRRRLEDRAAASVLLERAQKARKEAELMESDLINSKLRTLEGLLERQSQLSKTDEQDIQDRIDRLKNYRDPQPPQPPPTPSEPIDQKEEESMTEEEEIEDAFDEEYVKELTPEDKEALEQVQSIYFDFKDILNTTLLEGSEEFWGDMAELEDSLSSSLGGNITQEGLDFIKMARDAWKLTGMDGSDWKMMKGNITEAMADAARELERDPHYFDRLESLQGIIPLQLLDAEDSLLSEDDMRDFVQRVIMPINNEVFSLDNINATKVGSSYLLRGRPQLENGNEIINRIDKQLAETGLQDKFQCFLIIDTSESIEMLEDISVEVESMDDLVELTKNLGRRSLLVSPLQADLSPQEGPEVRALISLLAVFATSYFASTTYNQDVIGVTTPVFLGIIGIQLIHELGHFVAAVLNKIDIAFPSAVIPSLATGIMHSNTQIKSPPKNNNAMFDFALSGPLFGMAASLSALFYGLVQTAGAKTSEVASLPHMPLEFFQLSSLTSAIIESFLGTNVLLSLDPVSDNVAVHPAVIAGHIGILLNALNLLPIIDTTDGGRMRNTCISNTSNPVALVVILAIALPFSLIQGFRAWGTSSFLLLYTFLVPVIQHNVDIPCRNNVDPAGGIRPAFFVATFFLALIALSPAF